VKRTAVSAALVAALVLALAGSPAGAGPGPGYFASDNVEWITTMPIHTDSAGARIVGKHMYITTERDLTIYDLSKPAAPERVGYLPLVPPGQYYFPEEDVDTNGKILLAGNFDVLSVIDVEDKSNPEVISQLEGTDEHTISCVLDCKWAYGSEGVIVDLRKPNHPKVAGSWGKGMPAKSGHDVTEVAPGLVVTSTQPIMLLDARKDPAHPKLLAVGGNKDDRFIHGNLWPRGAKDRFLLAGGETFGPTCDESDGAFMVWDATKWRKSHSFTMIDEYRVQNGLPTEGDAPANQFCTHWFDDHPDFSNGGIVAMAWYEHGTRFLKVQPDGGIKEAGYFLPVGGSTSAAYWVNDEIVYAVDYLRGLDILRFKQK
jgi:hypothetical protein